MGKRFFAKRILPLSLSMALSAGCIMWGAYVSADTMSDLEAKQTELEKELSDVNSKLSEYEGLAKESEEYMNEYNAKMKLQEQQVSIVEKQIELCSQDIAGLEEEIADREKEVDSGIEQFRQRLRALYMAGNDSIASVLAGSGSFYDMLSRMEFVERISKHDSDLIDSLNIQIARLDNTKAAYREKLDTLESKKEEEEQYCSELRETYNNHAEAKQMREKLADDYRQRADEIQKEQEQTEQELQAEIRHLQEEEEHKRKLRQEKENRLKKLAQENNTEYVPTESTEPASYTDTGFKWPVPSIRNITDGYGERWIIEEQRRDFHKGIDIYKPECAGTEVTASAGGTVIQAHDKGNGYGNCVIIDHGGGISTLYAHNSSVAVNVGDRVTQGQVIAYIGHTGYALGDHCHFEVRIDGMHTDPFNYVSMDN